MEIEKGRLAMNLALGIQSPEAPVREFISFPRWRFGLMWSGENLGSLSRKPRFGVKDKL
jgi:hypothetical protein